jgi:hypothetical protein
MILSILILNFLAGNLAPFSAVWHVLSEHSNSFRAFPIALREKEKRPMKNDDIARENFDAAELSDQDLESVAGGRGTPPPPVPIGPIDWTPPPPPTPISDR